MQYSNLTNRSGRFLIRMALMTALLGFGTLASTAQAGYYDIYGYYHPTCVSGYWTVGPVGPIWVPPMCR